MAMKSFVSKILRPTNLITSGIFIGRTPGAHNFSITTQCYRVASSSIRPTNLNINDPKFGFDEAKAKLVLSLNFQSAEDAVPFYKLPVRSLIHIYKTSKNDEAKGYCKNRLYYISSRLKIPPAVLSEKLAKRIFIYSLSFDWIKRALDVLLEMGVSNDRILRDLWVLKYHDETIRNRLQLVKDMGVENLYPWMVRCSEDILNRFLSISQETKSILGETKSTRIYLANRLNTSIEDIEDMCFKVPALKTIRVTKVKHFLDFLINEGFDIKDIADKPRVLSASQKTVKERLDKLRTLGISPINLNVLCRSKKGFKRYCDTMEAISRESGNASSSS